MRKYIFISEESNNSIIQFKNIDETRSYFLAEIK